MAMRTNTTTSPTCPLCGGPVPGSPDPGAALQHCENCRPRAEVPAARPPAGDIFTEVRNNLGTVNTWREVIGWFLLIGSTFVPVMVLWGANRMRPDEPLLPAFLVMSAVGGALGMPLLYPKKGYLLPGIIAGPFFGPGVFLAFWLLAGTVMNKLIFAALVLLGGTPSFALYLYLLYRRACRGDAVQ